MKLDHILGDFIWRTTLNQSGLDVTVISFNTSSSTNNQKACNKESTARLQIGEKEKSNQDGHIDKDMGITLSG